MQGRVIAGVDESGFAARFLRALVPFTKYPTSHAGIKRELIYFGIRQSIDDSMRHIFVGKDEVEEKPVPLVFSVEFDRQGCPIEYIGLFLPKPYLRLHREYFLEGAERVFALERFDFHNSRSENK